MNSLKYTASEHLTKLLTLFLFFLLTVPGSSRVLEPVQSINGTILRLSTSVMVSADDRYVFFGGSQVNVFSRDAASSKLEFVDSLDIYSNDMLLSPDGDYLYLVAGRTVTVLAWRQGRGQLEVVETWSSPFASWHNSGQLYLAAAMSPDGQNLYVVDNADNPGLSGVTVLRRDSVDGTLALVEAYFDDTNGVDGLDGAREISVSPDGLNVYVISSEDDALAVFAREPSTGALTFLEALFTDDLGIDSFSDDVKVVTSPDGRHVYSNRVVFSRQTDTGRLTLVEELGFLGAGKMTFGPDGLSLYSTTDSGDSVVLYSRQPDTGLLTLVERYVDGTDGIEGLEHTTAVAVSPDGGSLYATSRQDSAAVFSRRADDGTLDYVAGGIGRFEGLDGAVALVLAPDERYLYALSERDDALTVFRRDASSGRLDLVETMYDDRDGIDGLDGAASMALSPDGQHLYVTTGGRYEARDHSLASFTRDPDTGSLSPLELFLDDVDGVDGLSSPNVLALSPDGASLYVASRRDSTLTIFARDLGTGKLSLVESLRFSDIGTSLFSPNALLVGPEGLDLFLTFHSDALAVFERDPNSGTLTPTEVFRDDTGGVDGLDGADAMAFSPDGRNLYVTSIVEGGVVVFDRPAPGTLRFREAYLDTDELRFAYSVAVDPDGQRVYVGSGAKIHIFDRDAQGSLRLQEIETEDNPPVRGLTFVHSIVMSTDGRDLYTAADLDRAVNLFRKQPGECTAGAETLCLEGNRFSVELDWRNNTGETGKARGVPFGSSDSGLLWFFDAENWEMLIKVLDACNFNDHFWVFAAATTDVEYTLRVTDERSGVTRTYFNPLGNAAPALTDTTAFNTCSVPPEAVSSPASDQSTTTMSSAGDELFRGPLVSTASFDPAAKAAQTSLLIGPGNLCAEAENGDFGSRIVLAECYDTPHQRWRLESAGTNLWEVQNLDGKCLHLGTAPTTGAIPVVLGSCGGLAAHWGPDRPPTPDGFRHAIGWCLAVRNGDTTPGATIGVNRCDQTAPDQSWRFSTVRCRPGSQSLCLREERFQVEVEWRDFEDDSGSAQKVVYGSDDSGLLWFFGPDNWEMLVKILDACDFNDRFWVFAAATTDVEYTLRVTDVRTGQMREYFNPLGNAAPALTDTEAFPSCP